LIDAILSLKVSSNVTTSLKIYKKADVNGDENIGIAETIYILQWLSGLYNTAPVLDPIGNKQAEEGLSLVFVISASDNEGGELTYFTSSLPDGAIFDSTTQTFSWTPYYTQSGLYNIMFTVRDNFGAEDSETITITVNDINPTLISHEYYPLAIGNWWDYEDESTSEIVRHNIPSGLTINGTLTYVYTYLSNYYRCFTSDSNGIKLYREYYVGPDYGAELTFIPPVLYMPDTCQIGTTQISNSTYTLWDTYNVEIASTTEVLAIEDVVTDNLILRDCIKIKNQATQYIIELDETVIGDPEYFWFYKGVGVVKYIMDEGSGTIVESNVNGFHRDY
jgi:hypothetical protein